MKLSVLSFALLVAACGGTQSNNMAPVDAASTEPAITAVASPATIAPGGVVTIAVSTPNFTIVDPRTGPAPKPGEGHYHYYLDDTMPYTAGWTPSVSIYTKATITPGVHKVRFLLATSAHMELSPTVEATATFTVQ